MHGIHPVHVAALAALLVALPSAVRAQSVATRDSVTVTPGPQYRAGGLHRSFFGTRYRRLWTTPIRVPVLDLNRFAGGLKPTQRGGGQQTKSLRFNGGDGREYQFRSVDKDPTVLLPPELQETFAGDILRDQISSAHPVGGLVVASLLDAAGVLHPRPILVVMPNDAALGEYRSEFAGMLGMIEERPKELADGGATFAGASAIEGTGDLYKRLDDVPGVQVDARAFLLARLTDVYMGDWDRHADQWRWALVGEGESRRWLPIPRDRDQAFVRFDGFLLGLARKSSPMLLNFGADYGDIIGGTWNGRELDRRFLAGLERPTWDSVTRVLKSRLTDQAIANAVRQMPPEFQPIEGPRLSRALRLRRDRLEWIENRYYRLLADQVEIYATDKDDDARVTREANGSTVVTLAHQGKQYFKRRFHPSETSEIRLHLQGGGDHFTVDGEGSGGPRLRVMGGGGNDDYTVRRGGGIHLYDDRGESRSEGAGVNTKKWSWKPDSLKPNELPPRDWGQNSLHLLTAAYNYDALVVLGISGYTEWYGFRRQPYSTRVEWSAEVATGKLSGRLTGSITRQFENSKGFYAIDALASGIETLRWYGFGNETSQTGSASFYRVNQNELRGGIRLGFRFGARNELSVGPVVRWSSTDTTEKNNAARFIGADQPYGVGHFGVAGFGARMRVDGRDHPHYPRRGGALFLQATGYPKLWDADEAIGRVEGEAAIALAPKGAWPPSLSLMAGAVKTWGKLPFFMAPTLGGTRTLRGYRPDRFAGDASVYGAAELRLPLTHARFIVPGHQGLFGFVDGGRVYREGEDSNEWHSSFGGGIWFSFLTPNNTLYVGLARPTKDKEGNRLILGFGFPY